MVLENLVEEVNYIATYGDLSPRAVLYITGTALAISAIILIYMAGKQVYQKFNIKQEEKNSSEHL